MSTDAPLKIVSHRSPLAALVGRSAVEADPSCTLAAAARLMEVEGVSALLLRDTVGIVTERDITRALARGCTPDVAVSRVATPEALVVDGRVPIVDACALMLNEEVRHLVVDLDGAFAIVSMRDVTAVLLQVADPHLWLTSLRVAVEGPAEIWLG